MMGPLSTLGSRDKQIARNIARRAALLGFRNAAALHYTEEAARWQGIDQNKLSEKGQFPTEADCSSFATWCLWNALHVRFSLPDNVNAAKWQGGYTGTLIDCGQPVSKLSDVRWGDLVIYGEPGDTKHVAIVTNIGSPRGNGVHVISNGSEGGPYWLPYNYRPDVLSIRRYI